MPMVLLYANFITFMRTLRFIFMRSFLECFFSEMIINGGLMGNNSLSFGINMFNPNFSLQRRSNDIYDECLINADDLIALLKSILFLSK